MSFFSNMAGWIVLTGALLLSCHRNVNVSDIVVDTISLDEPVPMVYMYDTNGTGLPIFYNMYLSVELTSLFSSSGAVFSQSLLNPHSNSANYLTSSKKALNLGVYAVDLSYLRVFEQLDLASNYFNSMQRLSEEMGIPSGYFEHTAQRFERNISDKDSLIKIANEVYMATDNYLKENERYGAASLVIIGGWVEAIYIACNVVAETKDIDIIDRLAEQKYSLENLINMLGNYSDDDMIVTYIEKLSSLQPALDVLYEKVQQEFGPVAPGKDDIEEYIVLTERLAALVKPVREAIVE